MAFDDVYSLLLNEFPQTDPRSLRAVAIEYSNDYAAAVRAVFDNLIPLTSASQREQALLSRVRSKKMQERCIENRRNEQFFHGCDDNEFIFDAHERHQQGKRNATGLKLSEKTREGGINLSGKVYCCGESIGYVDKKGAVVLHNEAPVDPKTKEKVPRCVLGKLHDVGMGVSRTKNQENDEEKYCIDENNDWGWSWGWAPSTFQDFTAFPVETSPQMVKVPIMQESDSENLEISFSTVTTSKAKTTNNVVGPEDGSTSNATMSQSSQIHIRVLDELIADARNNEKILFSTLEPVISLMREVELKEQAAELAKKEAAIRGQTIINKIEELRRIQKRANVGNQMHAWEGRGKKTIVVPELRDLQVRVLSLSDERNKSLAVIDELRHRLEDRLAAAEDEIKTAKQKKLDSELAARILLNREELTMKKMVQESKILKQRTEDNAKLQELLVDRGRAVDMLQGETDVICQDVRVLKKKFDETGSFSNQLSFMSDSPLKSLISDQTEPVPVRDDSMETRKETDHEKVSKDEASGDDNKAFLDNGWHFLDNREIEA